ncbi:MAG TPA: MmcQ/YjbR family DNA-binding protein, partial [Ruminiclostridium sp.]|nr:MmcQ/YjbR family DNA-binding protein [Ruminiclostridium sp.]
DALTNYCLSRKGAEKDLPFGPDVLVFKVADKMFALLSSRDNKLNLSLKCDPFLAQDFRQRYSSITPGYHLNKKNWNTIVIDGSIPAEELWWMIDHSYELVLKNLSKSVRDSI